MLKPTQVSATHAVSRNPCYLTTTPLDLVPPTRLMVIGGKPKRQSVELINLLPEEQATECLRPADMPEEMVGSVGAVIRGKVVVCGGWKVDKCYTYMTGEREWVNLLNLDRPRQNAASFQLEDGSWYVMGGRDNVADGVNLDTTLILKNGVFQLGPRLPYATNNPCVAKASNRGGKYWYMHIHYFFSHFSFGTFCILPVIRAIAAKQDTDYEYKTCMYLNSK